MNTAESKAKYEFALFYNNFIAELLQKPHTKEMHQLLLSKKARSDKELIDLYDCRQLICFRDIKMLKECQDPLSEKQHLIQNSDLNANLVQNTGYTQKFLLGLIRELPEELIMMIGAYSNHVKNQKSLIRIEFYNTWFATNNSRITKLLKDWSKAKLGVALNNIRSPNNPYYNSCQRTSAAYKNGSALMFRSRIETLIKEKGLRSNQEQYSLLLAIEKYNERK
jgi:hypothetical protein